MKVKGDSWKNLTTYQNDKIGS